jgi:myo-inositol catabolism protein IolC
LSTPDDIGKLQDILNTYEAATGTMVNMTKSRPLALGTWDIALKVMDVPYHTDVKILGFHFTNTVNTSVK